jgi:hypothetical protein
MNQSCVRQSTTDLDLIQTAPTHTTLVSESKLSEQKTILEFVLGLFVAHMFCLNEGFQSLHELLCDFR